VPYVVIDPDGNVRDLVPDVHAAVQAASQFSPLVQVENGPQRTGLGDLSDRRLDLAHPKKALARCGVKPMSLPTMSLDEAWKELVPYFPTTKLVRGKGKGKQRIFYEQPIEVPITAYSTPSKMARHLLGKNYKTAKEDLDFEVNTTVKGLSLLPSRSLAGKAGYERFANVDACVGASAACIAGCLVYSGHNDIDPYNSYVKAQRYKALVEKPQAFMRMLSENIAIHGRSRTAEPYVRLNVFSDLPWELICPELFAHHGGVNFYDYTKVANRDLSGTPNYDLTFSFSGENKAGVAHELSRGRRIAVVFIPTVIVPAKERERGEGLPESLDTDGLFGTNFGHPLEVRDGDVSDVRPRDPGRARGEHGDVPSIIGLRWKVPMGKQEEAIAKARASGFAIEAPPEPAYVVPVEEYGDLLIAATSARNEPIHDGDEDDEDDVEEAA
jgi:hypothetical protein